MTEIEKADLADSIRADERRYIARRLTELRYDGDTLIFYVKQLEDGDYFEGAPPRTPDEETAVKAFLSSAGKKGGSVSSGAKAVAVRANGAKGGRPKKNQEPGGGDDENSRKNEVEP